MRKKLKQAASALLDYTGIPQNRESARLKGRPDSVFIWIPKTAGTSIFQLLGAPKLKSLHLAKYRFVGHGPVTFCHMDYAELVSQGYIAEAFNQSAYKFTFVRNPYARAISLFYYMKRIKKRKVDPEMTFLDFYRNFKENGFEPIGLYNRKGLSQCNPQVRWTENTKIDFIGRIENIQEDANAIFKHLGLPESSIPQLNATARPKHTECYCDESKALIEGLYREDFETFGYDPNKDYLL